MLARLSAEVLAALDGVFEYVNDPAVLYQFLIIVALFLPAWLLSLRVEPKLEARARLIRGKRKLLRFIVAFLRRMEWLFFSILLGIAWVVTTIAAWPGRNHLIYSAMLLSGAWLLVVVVSNAIRSRFIARVFTWAAWIYVAAAILGITDDIVRFLGTTTFGFGDDVSLLRVLNGILLIGVLL